MGLHEHAAGAYAISETTFDRTLGEEPVPSTDSSNDDETQNPKTEQFDAVLESRLSHIATSGIATNLGGDWGPNRQPNSALSGKPQL